MCAHLPILHRPRRLIPPLRPFDLQDEVGPEGEPRRLETRRHAARQHPLQRQERRARGQLVAFQGLEPRDDGLARVARLSPEEAARARALRGAGTGRPRPDAALQEGLHGRAGQQRRQRTRQLEEAGAWRLGAAMYTSMFGMPVVWYAVATSPHGIVMAGRGPRPKSMTRVFQAGGTGTSGRPCARPRRGAGSRPSWWRCRATGGPSPGTRGRDASRDGSRRCRCAARQSEGTTSKPTPGSKRDAGLARFLVPRAPGLEHLDLAGDVEVVDARAQAAVRHRRRRARERARAVQHGGHPGQAASTAAVSSRANVRCSRPSSAASRPTTSALRPASTGRSPAAAARGRSARRCTRSRRRGASFRHGPEHTPAIGRGWP